MGGTFLFLSFFLFLLGTDAYLTVLEIQEIQEIQTVNWEQRTLNLIRRESLFEFHFSKLISRMCHLTGSEMKMFSLTAKVCERNELGILLEAKLQCFQLLLNKTDKQTNKKGQKEEE